MGVGDDAVIDLEGFDLLITLLGELGYRTIGPVVRDGAIVHGELTGADDLPNGLARPRGAWPLPARILEPRSLTFQLGGSARPRGSPSSSRSDEVVWRASVSNGELALAESPDEPAQPIAIIGARPCELAALEVLDRVLAGGAVRTPLRGPASGRFRGHGASAVSPAATCFCTSMGTGPAAEAGFDLALTELIDHQGHRFLVRVGSPIAGPRSCRLAGRRTVAGRGGRRAATRCAWRRRLGRRSAGSTPTACRLSGPQSRAPALGRGGGACLACGNCTLVCPTCFCSDVARHDRR